MHGFNEILSLPNVNLFLNTKVGDKITIESILKYNNAVLISSGMGESKKLNIEGSNLENIFESNKIVGWYNNVDKYKDFEINLENTKRISIIGIGNVALDCSRIFLKSYKDLLKTDISKKALLSLKSSNVDTVNILGRRGPLQSSFTISELREIFNLEDVSVQTDRTYLEEYLTKYKAIWSQNRALNRLSNLMLDKFIHHDGNNFKGKSKRCIFNFGYNPIKFIGQLGKVEDVVFEKLVDRSEIDISPEKLKLQKFHQTGLFGKIPSDMVVTCLGYFNSQFFGLKTEKTGVISNYNGRVGINTGIYVAGWAAGGAKGDLAVTLRTSNETADKIIEDLDSDIKIHKDNSIFAEYINKVNKSSSA